MTKQEEIRNKILANIYGIVSDACHRAEKGDTQWHKDPNHFLLDYASQILTYLHSQGELPYKQEEIDIEILDLVNALNLGGIPTAGSCSGHGKEHGYILLGDERTLIILPAPMDKDYITRELQFNQSIKLKPR
jgi:hypothetical protein